MVTGEQPAEDADADRVLDVLARCIETQERADQALNRSLAAIDDARQLIRTQDEAKDSQGENPTP